MRAPPRKPFVVISGVPGAGKTSLGRRLAPALALPLLDKDDILDALFERKGIGDASWRRALSRESDAILRERALGSSGAILVSFWRVAGMPHDSGTPTDWIDAPAHRVVHVHCVCPVEIAAGRFAERRRHPGHLDAHSSMEERLLSIRQVAALPVPDLGRRLDADTSTEPDLDHLLPAIRRALAKADAPGR